MDTQPRLRSALEATVGRRAADLGLAALSALGQGLAGGWFGLAVDAAARAGAVAEARAARGAWQAREADQLADAQTATADPVVVERPRPLPPGPVEYHADRTAVAGLGALAVGLPVTGLAVHDRQAAVSTSRVPTLPDRAVRLGDQGGQHPVARPADRARIVDSELAVHPCCDLGGIRAGQGNDLADDHPAGGEDLARSSTNLGDMLTIVRNWTATAFSGLLRVDLTLPTFTVGLPHSGVRVAPVSVTSRQNSYGRGYEDDCPRVCMSAYAMGAGAGMTDGGSRWTSASRCSSASRGTAC